MKLKYFYTIETLINIVKIVIHTSSQETVTVIDRMKTVGLKIDINSVAILLDSSKTLLSGAETLVHYIKMFVHGMNNFCQVIINSH